MSISQSHNATGTRKIILIIPIKCESLCVLSHLSVSLSQSVYYVCARWYSHLRAHPGDSRGCTKRQLLRELAEMCDCECCFFIRFLPCLMLAHIPSQWCRASCLSAPVQRWTSNNYTLRRADACCSSAWHAFNYHCHLFPFIFKLTWDCFVISFVVEDVWIPSDGCLTFSLLRNLGIFFLFWQNFS